MNEKLWILVQEIEERLERIKYLLSKVELKEVEDGEGKGKEASKVK